MQTPLRCLAAELALLREEFQTFRIVALDLLRDIHDRVDAISEKPGKPPSLLTVKEACSFLRCNRQTLWRLTRQGDLRPSRVGRGLRYAVRELERYLDRTARRRKAS